MEHLQTKRPGGDAKAVVIVPLAVCWRFCFGAQGELHNLQFEAMPCTLHAVRGFVKLFLKDNTVLLMFFHGALSCDAELFVHLLIDRAVPQSCECVLNTKGSFRHLHD